MVDSTPTCGGSAVEHRLDAPVEIAKHVVRIGRADAARAVGGGRGDRPPGLLQERMGEGMGRHAQAHAVETGAGEIADRAGRRHRHHQGQRAGPERLRQLPRGVVEQALRASALRSCRRWAISGLKLGRSLAA